MDMTVKELQDYLGQLYRKLKDDHGLFMKLVEEIGETAQILNKRSGRKTCDIEDPKAELANELADIVHYTVAIAAVNGIDLSEAILEKDDRASAKYGHGSLRQFMSKTGE